MFSLLFLLSLSAIYCLYQYTLGRKSCFGRDMIYKLVSFCLVVFFFFFFVINFCLALPNVIEDFA